MNILELYSGIGGMHMAFNESGIAGQIIAACDINTVANIVYSHNFPETTLLNRNIQSLTSKYINKLNIDAIFMSPPCQPFTRNGLKGDHLDPRTCSFTYLLTILPELHVKYILIENVKGFETSIIHDTLINALKNNNFTFQELILSPTQVGVSNTRHRYYCIAKKNSMKFRFQVNSLIDNLPNLNENIQLSPISETLEENINIEAYLLPDIILKKRAMLLDICTPTSKRSCCFTKAYGRYVEGTGSVFTTKSESDINRVYNEFKKLDSCDDSVKCLHELQLRFFTPTEVSRLMSFPKYFSFPDNLSNIQKYRLLGNSINVKVVAELMKLLVE